MLNIIYDAAHIKWLAACRQKDDPTPNPFEAAALLLWHPFWDCPALVWSGLVWSVYLTDAELQIRIRARISWNLFLFCIYIRYIQLFSLLLFVSNLHIAVDILAAHPGCCRCHPLSPSAFVCPLSWQPLANLLPSLAAICSTVRHWPCSTSGYPGRPWHVFCASGSLHRLNFGIVTLSIYPPPLLPISPAVCWCCRHDFIQSLFGNLKCKVKSTCLAAKARTQNAISVSGNFC